MQLQTKIKRNLIEKAPSFCENHMLLKKKKYKGVQIESVIGRVGALGIPKLMVFTIL
jgi:hypothetical protein